MIIIDASVGAKWVLPREEHRDKAMLLLERHLSETEKIMVPDLFFYEIANSLVTKVNVPLHIVIKSAAKINSNSLQVYHPNYSDIQNTIKLAKKYKTSVYDMLYAVVAKIHKTFLVTADKRFVKKTNLPYIKSLSA